MAAEKNISDNELLIQLKNVNAHALKILFDRYYPGLFYFAIQLLKNHQLAEEVVMDVFLNLWTKKATIEINTSLKAYLYTSVRNQSLNYIKRNRAKFEHVDYIDGVNISSDFSADQPIHTEDLIKEINALLKKLPRKRELIFRMNRFDGLTYKEIAETLSISVNTVQNQMVKAAKYISGKYPGFKKLFTIFLSLFP
ncbi:MAG: RNA polymerase sigma-70 factor [Ignavibacteriales bacterium]|nr:RNA polymerase sigma-70 factor [Ignavibacteriales bacterium]